MTVLCVPGGRGTYPEVAGVGVLFDEDVHAPGDVVDGVVVEGGDLGAACGAVPAEEVCDAVERVVGLEVDVVIVVASRASMAAP